ncbi:hypothetical protein J1605_002611 [Eschrichtius robustus]|uniref:E2 ubiquitin-conjugating enzyme n=1 Tax=Eschrichtius robustus TaxID=9764 RepID=A0AB34HWW7_ESCRO|nr:hypothetical protein J1605_002611 [Eschrichtius robustus]
MRDTGFDDDGDDDDDVDHHIIVVQGTRVRALVREDPKSQGPTKPMCYNACTLEPELEDLQKGLPRYLRNLFSEDADVLVWHALLLPEKPPYNLKAFNLRISFPEEYPFKPPTVTFTTRIYHPNVDSSGRVCLPIISKENWKPFTKTCQVLEALNVLVNKPELGQPLRLELADQLTQDPELFNRRAEEFTLQFGVDRPS